MATPLWTERVRVVPAGPLVRERIVPAVQRGKIAPSAPLYRIHHPPPQTGYVTHALRDTTQREKTGTAVPKQRPARQEQSKLQRPLPHHPLSVSPAPRATIVREEMPMQLNVQPKPGIMMETRQLHVFQRLFASPDSQLQMTAAPPWIAPAQFVPVAPSVTNRMPKAARCGKIALPVPMY